MSNLTFGRTRKCYTQQLNFQNLTLKCFEYINSFHVLTVTWEPLLHEVIQIDPQKEV